MTPIENLYYALGELAYAMAKVDGTVQVKEKDKLHGILIEEFGKHNSGIDVTEIIFSILKKDAIDAHKAYERAIHQIKLNSQYVSEPLKKHFIAVLQNIAVAYPPVIVEEHTLLSNIIDELKKIKGDDVFMSSN